MNSDLLRKAENFKLAALFVSESPEAKGPVDPERKMEIISTLLRASDSAVLDAEEGRGGKEAA